MVIDIQQGKTDRYGRTLAFIYRYPDGLFINAEIIRQGYGHTYTNYPFKYMEEFRQLERFAKEAEKGLWEQVPNEKTSTKEANPPVVVPVIKPQKKISSSDDDMIVYVTQTGKKYHRSGCRYLSKSKIPISLKEAKTSYSPCSVCSPPQ